MHVILNHTQYVKKMKHMMKIMVLYCAKITTNYLIQVYLLLITNEKLLFQKSLTMLIQVYILNNTKNVIVYCLKKCHLIIFF
ncbi:hypothetical protein P271_448 [Malacoplasma iowae DK-CPA]|uniref:Uncharacterized protein n=1 Tax=Malacoplasma iowae DK-CPA TaxID=1394179 RepID=A0A084U3R5_MALIO|nr:hypothetical protein P271_448 [Malacoplasma iowae DK-CPA]